MSKQLWIGFAAFWDPISGTLQVQSDLRDIAYAQPLSDVYCTFTAGQEYSEESQWCSMMIVADLGCRSGTIVFQIESCSCDLGWTGLTRPHITETLESESDLNTYYIDICL